MKMHVIANNQTAIETDSFIILFSYSTPVACYDKENDEYSRTSKKWSATTSKHINKWLPRAADERDQSFFDKIGLAA